MSESSVFSSKKKLPILKREKKLEEGAPIKKRSKLIPGLDYGADLLANSKFTPPNSPIPGAGRRSLNLDFDEESTKPGRMVSHASERSVSRHQSRTSSRRSSRGHEEVALPGIDDELASQRHHSRSHSRPRERSERRSHDRSRHESRSHDRSRERERSERRERERSDRRSRESSRHHHYDDNRSEHYHRPPVLSPSDYEVTENGEESRIDRNINDIILEDSEDQEKERRRSHSRHREYDRDDDRDDDRRSHHLLDDDMKEMRERAGDDDDDDDREKHHSREDEDERIDVSNMSPKEIMKRKRKSLLHIKILQAQGYEPYKDVGITNPLEEILEVEDEQKTRRQLTNGIELGKKFLVGASYIAENLNKKYDPFDLKLDGWSDQMFEDKDEYNEVLEELYFKYSDQVAMAPELKLLMMLGCSAMMFHFSKSMMDSGNLEVPNFEAVMNKHPDIKHAYEQAALNLMMEQQGKPGGSREAPNMMSNILGSMAGDSNVGNQINNFMNTGGRNVKRSPPAVSIPGAPRPNRSAKSQVNPDDIEIIPPADPDNILGGGSSAPMNPRRTTRNQRDSLSQLVV